MYLIDFENIFVGYDEKIVLKNINLKIKQGEHWAILGANGSGKSTLLKLILSEIHPRQISKFKKEILGKSRYSIFELKQKLGIITNDLHNYFLNNASYMSGFEVVLSGFYSSIGIFTHQDFTKGQIKRVLEVINILDISNLSGEAPSIQTIYRYLNGSRELKVEILPYFAEVLGVKEQDFFEFDVEFATNNNIKQSKEVREILNLLQYLPARAINDLKNKLYEYRKLYEKGF